MPISGYWTFPIVYSGAFAASVFGDFGAEVILAGVIDHALRDTIHISITPHGLDGPLVGTSGNNLTACARSGWPHSNIYKDEPPLQLPNRVSGYVAWIAGFITGATSCRLKPHTE